MGKEVIDDKDDDKEPPLIVVDEAEREAHEAAQREAAAGPGDDEDDDDDSGSGDDRLGKGRNITEEEVAARGNETDEQRRERNRKNKQAKRLRVQAARERDARERAFLETRNEQLEKRLMALEKGTANSQIMAVDGRISTIQEQIRQANDLMAQAVEAGAGADVVKITEIRDELNSQLSQLKGYKQHLQNGGQAAGESKAAPQEQQQQRRPPADPRVASHSRDFQDNLPWFDPAGKDTDSAVVYALDVSLSKDGRYDPRTKKYWTELEKRVKAALPHRFDDPDDDLQDDEDEADPPPRNGKGGGPRLPSSGGDRGVRGKNTFYISKERKQALIDAGVWDDEKLRAKYIKKYQAWDQQNAGQK